MEHSDSYLNSVFYGNAQRMRELPSSSVDLIVTSPPYFNIKDYSKDGYQAKEVGDRQKAQIGDIEDYTEFIAELLKVWRECERVLKPNGKMAINAPLVPMKKADYTTHHNRHLFDLNADIQHSILSQQDTEMFLYDVYIWNRTNSSKTLMFGSYPYPRNFYAQNTSEFISVYVKDGKPTPPFSRQAKEHSKLSEAEWVEFTKQIWNLNIPGKDDIAFGEHAAIMPEDIALRCIKMFSFEGDVVLDPFAGSGTTLKVAAEQGRSYVGYELMETYRPVIEEKIAAAEKHVPNNRRPATAECEQPPGPPKSAAAIKVLGLELCPIRQEATRDGYPLCLTKTQFAILETLASQPGKVIATQTICAKAWGNAPAGGYKSLTSPIAKLRQEMEAGGKPRLVHNVRGVGYVLREQA